jgi:hypothetical protein
MVDAQVRPPQLAVSFIGLAVAACHMMVRRPFLSTSNSPHHCSPARPESGRCRPLTKGWSRAFDEPISLPDGGELRTLLDAGRYVDKYLVTIRPARYSASDAKRSALVLLTKCRTGMPLHVTVQPCSQSCDGTTS